MSLAELIMQVNNLDMPLNEWLDPYIKAQSKRKKVFTENGMFIVPDGVTEIYVSGCASGGNASVTNEGKYITGGLAGEWIFKKPLAVTPMQEIPIVVGSGNTIIGDIILLTALSSGVFMAMFSSFKSSGYAGNYGIPVINGVNVGEMPGVAYEPSDSSINRRYLGGSGTPFGVGGGAFNTDPDPINPKCHAFGYGAGAGLQYASTYKYKLGNKGLGIAIIEW